MDEQTPRRLTTVDFDPDALRLFDLYVHGFNNDTTPRYNEGAAIAAWKKTLAL